MGDLHEGGGKSIQNGPFVEGGDSESPTCYAFRVRSLAISLDDTGAYIGLWASTALKKLEDNTLTISDSLREKAKALMFDPGNCQLTIQMTRENLDDVRNQLPFKEPTVTRDEDSSHQTEEPDCDSVVTKQATEAALIDMDSIQRQTLALIPTGMKPSVAALATTSNKLNITDMSTEDLSMLGKLLQTNQRICAMLELQNTRVQSPPAKSIEDSFVFGDVLGREHRLEYRWFRHWEIFAAMLKCTFKDMPGEEHVASNRYLIFDPRTAGHGINEDTWKYAVFPGSRVRMSITISRQQIGDAQCPKCSKISSMRCCTSSDLYRW